MSEPNSGPALPASATSSTHPRFIDMTGRRIGRLVVVERAPNRGDRVYWRCQCDCGNEHVAPGTTLRRAKPTSSCGCIERERQVDRASPEPACRRPTAKYPEGRTGTVAGYLAHYFIGQQPCAECSEAVRRDNAERFGDDPTRALRMTLWSKYRLTLQRYEEILAEQGGTCAICSAESPGDYRAGRFHVDHDHACCPGDKSCGQCIRGLLCRGCNTALGNFADDPARLRRAADYLDQWPGVRPATGLRPRITRKAARHGAEGTVAS